MEINKDKKQKELERRFLAPNLRPFLSLTIKEDTDIEDEFALESDDKTQKKIVQQKIKTDPKTKMATFITELHYEQQIENDKGMREDSTITYMLPVGTILIWEEGTGYIVAEQGFQTLEEMQETINLLKE